MKTDNSTKSKTILVVDDRENIFYFLTKLLLGEGYRVMRAATNETALKTYGVHQDIIDLVILDDHKSPDSPFDYSFLEQCTAPVLLMSASSAESLPVPDNIHVLQKPVVPNMVLEYISRLL